MAKKFNIETGKFEDAAKRILNIELPEDGKDGRDGIDGRDGKDGKDGINGKDGLNGKDGIDGKNGKDGADGKDGVGIQSINQPLPNKIEVKLTNDESYFLDLPKGADGKEIEFKTTGEQVDWRYKDGEWKKLFTIPRVIGGSGGGTRKVKDLRDVTITGVTDGQVLTWSDSAQAWVNGAGGSGGTITTQDEGITLSSSVTTLNFVGAGVTASGAGATTTITIPGGGGSGDVVGPASSTDNAISRYDGTTGKLLQNSSATIDDLGNVSATSLITDSVKASSSSGLILENSGGGDVLHVGNGGGVNATAYGGWNFDAVTASRIAGFGASKTLEALDTATYPSLTELAYVKGTTSAIQTQLNAKADNSFTTIAVSGQSDVVADTATDTLTLVAGTNITITTNAGTDTITISASGGGGGITQGQALAYSLRMPMA